MIPVSYLFFFNDTPTTQIYTLSLHDALPISSIMENTNLSKQQQVSEIMRQMLTQAQTAVAWKEDRKSGSAGMPRPISYAVFCLKKKKKNSNTNKKSIITTTSGSYAIEGKTKR